MEKRFVVPAVSFIAAVLIWVVFFVLHLVGGWVQARALWLEVALSLVVGGLVLFSAVRCHQVGGPRVGGVVRAVALLLMGLFTYWKVGVVAAYVLLAIALVTGARALLASDKMEAAGDLAATSSQAPEKAE